MRYLLTLILILISTNAYALYEDQKRNEELFRQTKEMHKNNLINDIDQYERGKTSQF